MGYSLSYFNGDYRDIAHAFAADNFLASLTDPSMQNSNLMQSRYDLFNGNISSMVTTLPTAAYTSGGTTAYSNTAQGYGYVYDQLNRISDALAFQNLNAGNYWQNDASALGKYHNHFTYDANGNILSQDRADASNTPFDQLSYQYDKYVNGKLRSNRLFSVTDAIGSTIKSDDIDNQSANNYVYDDLGNLVHDEQEEIANITWTVMGKIGKIIRKSSSSKVDLEFKYDATGNRVQKIVKPHGSSIENGGADDQTQWTITNYVVDATGNTMAMYQESTSNAADQYALKEKYLYGSSRLGVDNTEVDMYTSASANPFTPLTHTMGLKQYELSNHLGNILATVSDRKIPVASGGTIDHYLADVISISDYYPFGSTMAGRTYNSTNYRYGFGGHEKDNEVSGEGNHLPFGDYGLDTRLGRRWNVEPLIEKYPSFSSYLVFGNNPILNTDPDGKDIIVLAHGYREDPAGPHRPGHQAVLIGNQKDGWKFYSYDYDKGENKGSDANSANNIYTSGQPFKSLDEFAKSEYNTFKDDYDDGKGLETSHKDKEGKVLQRFTAAFQITTSAETDEKMKAGAKKTFKKPYSILTGNQCTRVAKNALDAGGLKNGETSKVTRYQGKSDLPYQTTEENYLPATKQAEIERSNKGTKIDEKIKR